jgi:general stress protein CsbA
MSHAVLATITVLAATNKTFHIGPWIIVPLLILAAVIGTLIYVTRDRRKRQSR